MPAGDMYQAWANSTPTMPFPFTFQDKKVGKIQQTWQDVKEGIRKDAASMSLPFCMSHITPSIVQANIIGDNIKRENRMHKRWTVENELRRSMSPGHEEDEYRSYSTTSSIRAAIRTAQEQDALTNSEGGRGRLTYLRMRHQLSPQVRFDGRPRTSSHTYGWSIETPEEVAAQYRSMSTASPASQPASPSRQPLPAIGVKPEDVLAAALEQEKRRFTEPLGQGIATGLRVTGSRPTSDDHRRKNTLKGNLRASGVFARRE